MTKRILVLVCLSVLTSGISHTQATNQPFDDNRVEAVRSRLLDRLFQTNIASLKGPHSRLVLRFSKPDTECVLLIYASWKSELVVYTLKGLGSKSLAEYISDMLRANPQVQDDAIADSIGVTTKRSFLDSQKVRQSIEELKKITLSPFLEQRIAVDEYSDYDLWFESAGNESVHYKLHGPSESTPADRLVRWMCRFRAGLGETPM